MIANETHQPLSRLIIHVLQIHSEEVRLIPKNISVIYLHFGTRRRELFRNSIIQESPGAWVLFRLNLAEYLIQYPTGLRAPAFVFRIVERKRVKFLSHLQLHEERLTTILGTILFVHACAS